MHTIVNLMQKSGAGRHPPVPSPRADGGAGPEGTASPAGSRKSGRKSMSSLLNISLAMRRNRRAAASRRSWIALKKLLFSARRGGGRGSVTD